MAEAIAALSLASNIVQFVDFAIKLVSNGTEIYRSVDGRVKENVEMENILADLQELTFRLAGTPDASKSTLQTDTSVKNEIEKLASTCTALSKELTQQLEQLHRNPGKGKTWKSVKKSIRSVLKRSELERLESRILKIREQISFHLIILLREDQLAIRPLLGRLDNAMDTFGEKTERAVQSIREDLSQYLRSRDWSAAQGAAYERVPNLLLNLKEAETKFLKTYHILESLHFQQIKSRQSQIKLAHKQTFEWLFHEDDRLPDFSEWLETNQEVFWISGKAGSGKSTLMKFLINHQKTQELLETWAYPASCISASHFFWALGTPLQKSQEGLLRTLLFQVLSQCPNLIPVICATRWKASSNLDFRMSESWSLAELTDCVVVLSQQGRLPVKFCFFIDGLDEYDGEQEDIVEIIQTMAKCKNIKFCVSSRPWTVFRDTWGHLSWKLAVHELTGNDIEVYVRDKLQNHKRFAILRTESADALIFTVKRRAEGVFLWVYLVVQSLLRGLSSDDDISHLLERVMSLPSDLEAYFRLIFQNIEAVYRRETAHIFRVLLAAYEPPSTITFALLDNGKAGELSLLESNKPLPQDCDLTDVLETQQRRLHVRCRDLITIHVEPEQECFFVQVAAFLHRTVHDFLKIKEFYELLVSWSDPDFEPHRELCDAYLGQFRLLPEEDSMSSIKHHPHHHLTQRVLCHAREMEEHGIPGSDIRLDTMNQMASRKWKGHRHWSEYMVEKPISDLDFSSLLVKCGIQGLLPQLIAKNNNAQKLLMISIEHPLQLYQWPLQVDDSGSLNLSVIELLLSSGADPNKDAHGRIDGGSSIWIQFLRRELRQRTDDYYKACELLVHYGADMDERASEFLKKYFSEQQVKALERLVPAKVRQVELDPISTQDCPDEASSDDDSWVEIFH